MPLDGGGRPGFMTTRMWFVWLLRGDIRQGARIDSDEGQREFVVWWLLWGHQEYYPDWTAAPEQLAVAMEPVSVEGRPVPRLLLRLHRTSKDLQKLFDIGTAAGRAEYFAWYGLYGKRDLPIAPPLPTYAAPASRQLARPAAAGLRTTAVLRAETGGRQLRSAADHPAAHASSARSSSVPASLVSASAPQSVERRVRRAKPVGGASRFGANLVGFAYGELGIGEDVRMLSLSLTEVGVEHVVVDVPTLAHTRSEDRSVAGRVLDRIRYPVTIFCVSPFDTGELHARGRDDLFAADYNIGYWPWELPDMPPVWREVYGLVDEVWAASRYTAAAFQRSAPVPVQVLPPCVDIPGLAKVRAAARKLRDSRPDRFRFFYPFDRNSYLARKNPGAAIEAFRRAFSPDDGGVELVLRVNGESGNDEDVAKLRHAVLADQRIVLREGTLPKADALALLASSDCLVSPHRAEGFGRNIAEAILLQVPVVATRFGGCVDFLYGDEAIDWRPVGIRDGEYPFAHGQWWAEPDIEHLARRMQEIRASRLQRGERATGERRAQFQSVYGPGAAGARYAARLHDIRAQRPGADGRPLLRAGL